MTRDGALRALAVASVLVATACSDAPPTAPIAPDVRLVQHSSVDQLALGRAIPSFGGLFLDASGAPTVYLTDPGSRGAVASALSSFLRERGFSAADLRVVRGDYGYVQLDRWFNRLSPEAMAVEGAVFIDLDEANNRVLVGVENPAAAASVRDIAARFGLPGEAVVVRETEPIHLAATLRDVFRPTQAGIQIHFGQYVCTMGFNVDHSGGRSFITNSHCTNTQGGTEGTVYYQPTSTLAPSSIATEADDPVYFKGGVCPRGKKCRYSDASRALYQSATESSRGVIAKPDGVNTLSLTVAGMFDITSQDDQTTTFVIGDLANKIGRTTGWTRGGISNTCVNTSVQGSQVMQLCQTFVSATNQLVAGGDSGSPVFFDTGTNTAKLVGILWGGNSSGTQFVFSPLASIKRELGAMTPTK